MDIRPIKTDADYALALKEVERLWSAPEGSRDADKLDVLATLIDAFEAQKFPLSASDPIETIQVHMEMTGRTQADLAALLGSRSRASEILNRKRALTVEMIHKISTEWNLPAELLIKPYRVAA